MISRLTVQKGVRMPYQCEDNAFAYPFDIDLKFSEGLNVIVGPNGCGKTTALTIMKTFVLVGEEYTHSSDRCFTLQKFFRSQDECFWHYKDNCPFGVFSDYTNKAFYMPSMLEIFRGCMSSENVLSLAKATSRHSRGESSDVVVRNMLAFVKEQKGHFDYQSAYNWILSERNSNHPYIEGHRIPDDGRTTVLFDEPDSHLDIFMVQALSDVLTKGGEEMQLIVTIHNPLLICTLAKNKDVHFIEMEAGYVGKVKKTVQDMAM